TPIRLPAHLQGFRHRIIQIPVVRMMYRFVSFEVVGHKYSRPLNQFSARFWSAAALCRFAALEKRRRAGALQDAGAKVFPPRHGNPSRSCGTMAEDIYFFSSTTSASMIGPSSFLPSSGWAPRPPASGPGPGPAPGWPWPARALSDAALYSSPETCCQTSLSFSLADLMAALSLPFNASLTSATAFSILPLESPEILSALSLSNFSVRYTALSASLRVSTSSRAFLSSSAWAS